MSDFRRGDTPRFALPLFYTIYSWMYNLVYTRIADKIGFDGKTSTKERVYDSNFITCFQLSDLVINVLQIM